MVVETAAAVTLRVREWLAVAVTCGLLVGMSLLTVWRGSAATAPLPPPEKIEVIVKGAVAAPGVYRVTKEGGVAALLALAGPLSDADLKRAPKLQKNSDGVVWRLFVPSRDYVEVEISGAVKVEGIYRLPKGVKQCDLSRYVEMSPTADPKWLKRRRLLVSGEALVVPSQ